MEGGKTRKKEGKDLTGDEMEGDGKEKRRGRRKRNIRPRDFIVYVGRFESTYRIHRRPIPS